jgi:hypothetical protein
VQLAEVAQQLATFPSKNRQNHAVLRAKHEEGLVASHTVLSRLAWRAVRWRHWRWSAVRRWPVRAGYVAVRAAAAYMASGQGRCPVLQRSL